MHRSHAPTSHPGRKALAESPKCVTGLAEILIGTPLRLAAGATAAATPLGVRLGSLVLPAGSQADDGPDKYRSWRLHLVAAAHALRPERSAPESETSALDGAIVGDLRSTTDDGRAEDTGFQSGEPDIAQRQSLVQGQAPRNPLNRSVESDRTHR